MLIIYIMWILCKFFCSNIFYNLRKIFMYSLKICKINTNKKNCPLLFKIMCNLVETFRNYTNITVNHNSIILVLLKSIKTFASVCLNLKKKHIRYLVLKMHEIWLMSFFDDRFNKKCLLSFLVKIKLKK